MTETAAKADILPENLSGMHLAISVKLVWDAHYIIILLGRDGRNPILICVFSGMATAQYNCE